MQDRAAASYSRYSVPILVMQEMQWSWADFQDAPFDLVEEIVVRIQAREHWNREKAKQRIDQAKQRAAKGR